MTFQKGNKIGHRFTKGHKINLGRKMNVEPHKGQFQKGHKGFKSLGEKNGQWSGNDVGYINLHVWVKRHFPKPELCPECNIKPPYDLANITGKYTRDFENWKYLCRKCHMILDGRMNNLKQFQDNSLNENQ